MHQQSEKRGGAGEWGSNGGQRIVVFWEPKQEKIHFPAVSSMADDGPLDFSTK